MHVKRVASNVLPQSLKTGDSVTADLNNTSSTLDAYAQNKHEGYIQDTPCIEKSKMKLNK